MTSKMRLADAPGNVRVTRRASGLPQESVVNVSQLIMLDKQRLTEKVGRLPAQSTHSSHVVLDPVGALPVKTANCASKARL